MYLFDLVEQREAPNQPRDAEGKYDTTGPKPQPASVAKANYTFKKGDQPGSKMKVAPKNVTSKGVNNDAEFVQSVKTGNIFKNPTFNGNPNGKGQVALNGKFGNKPKPSTPLVNVSTDPKYLATGKVPPNQKSKVLGVLPKAPAPSITNPTPTTVKATMPTGGKVPVAPSKVTKGVKPTRLIAENPSPIESEKFMERVGELWAKQQQDLYGAPKVPQGPYSAKLDVKKHDLIGKGKSITESEKGAIKNYSQSSFREMNLQLRDKNGLSDITDGFSKRNIEEAANYLNKCVIKDEIALVRNINDADLTRFLQIGDEVYDPAFISTSTRNGVFSSYGSVEMRIRVPAGSRGRSIRKWSSHRGEDEVVLPPGATFRVMQREVFGNRTRLYVDLIQQGLRPDAAILGRSFRSMEKRYWIQKDQVQKFTTDLSDGGVAVNGIFPSGKVLTDGKTVKRGLMYRAEGHKPTDGMKEEARKGLEWRKEFGRGGTLVGVARARDIVNGSNLPLQTVKRMYSFFSRHEVDKKAQGFRPGEDGFPSAGRIAWALWGGDAGFSWSKKIVASAKVEKNMNTRELPNNYRPASNDDVPEGRNCASCAYFGNGFCDYWDEPVAEDYYCDEWEAEGEMEVDDMSPLQILIADLKALVVRYESLMEMTEPEEDSWNPESREEPNGLETGDFVSWQSSGGKAFGKILRIERDGKIDVPDSSFTITGSPDNPAALIRVYRKEESKAVPTDVKVGHKFSALTKIDSPNE